MMQKTNKPCFTCGSLAADWIARNCDRCIKAERTRDGNTYTKCRCTIQRDILTQWMGSGTDAINTRSWMIAQLDDCPKRTEHYAYRRREKKEPLNQTTLW